MAKPSPDANNKMTSPFGHLLLRAFNTYTYAVVVCLLPLVLASNWLGETATALIVTGFGLVLLFILTYSTFWGTAERDRNLVLFGHMKEDRWRALRAACYSMIPLAVMTILAVADAYAGGFLPDWFKVVYRVVSLPFVFFVRTATDAPGPFSWLLILICGWTPFAAWFGYRNGTKLIRLMDRIVYKQKPRERDKRLR